MEEGGDATLGRCGTKVGALDPNGIHYTRINYALISGCNYFDSELLSLSKKNK